MVAAAKLNALVPHSNDAFVHGASISAQPAIQEIRALNDVRRKGDPPIRQGAGAEGHRAIDLAWTGHASRGRRLMRFSGRGR